MIRAKNYETVSKFVKVMTKILWPLFFRDTVFCLQFLSSYKLMDGDADTIPYSFIKHDDDCLIHFFSYL